MDCCNRVGAARNRCDSSGSAIFRFVETKTKNALFECELKLSSITVSNDSAVAAGAGAGAGAVNVAVTGAVNVAVTGAVSVALQLAFPAVEKFCRASSAGGRRHLQ